MRQRAWHATRHDEGKPTNVDFQNPFLEPVEFSLQAVCPSLFGSAGGWFLGFVDQVDNPSFQLAQRAFKLDPKKNASGSAFDFRSRKLQRKLRRAMTCDLQTVQTCPTCTNTLHAKLQVPIPVSFVGDRPLGGRLLVSTSRVSTPWAPGMHWHAPPIRGQMGNSTKGFREILFALLQVTFGTFWHR